jgi:EamA domain-containing membrane protein RarD
LNPTLFRAVAVVTLALIFYSLGVINEQRKHYVTPRILLFLTLGVILDISSTILMIIGARKIPITVHGFIGYSALILMLTDTILIWRHWRHNRQTPISNRLNWYTRIAYGWWVAAYIAGAVIAMVLTK